LIFDKRNGRKNADMEKILPIALRSFYFSIKRFLSFSGSSKDPHLD
jgi:hypothetical protein